MHERIKNFIGFGLGFFLVIVSVPTFYLLFLIDDVRSTVSRVNKLIDDNEPALTSTVNNLKIASDKLPLATQDLSVISNKAKDFTNIVATEERAKEVANYLDVLNFNSQVAQNDIRLAIAESKATSIMLRKQAEPILISANELVKEGTATVAELKHQIKQNGDEINALLLEGKTLVKDSRESLLTTLDNLNKTTYGLQVITNDPNLQQLIQNTNLTLGNVQVITKETADLATHYLHPLSHPKPAKGINKYLFQPLIKVVRLVNGAGQVFFLINSIGG